MFFALSFHITHCIVYILHYLFTLLITSFIYYLQAINNYCCYYKLFYKMFSLLTTFNLSDKSISHNSFSNSLHFEDFASQVQWFINSLHHFEKKKIKQEAMNKIHQNFSQLKIKKNSEYVQWTLNTDNSFLWWWF